MANLLEKESGRSGIYIHTRKTSASMSSYQAEENWRPRSLRSSVARRGLGLRLRPEYEIGRNSLITGDRYFLTLRAVEFVPSRDRVLAWKQATE